LHVEVHHPAVECESNVTYPWEVAERRNEPFGTINIHILF
jgi:hypothetical protein